MGPDTLKMVDLLRFLPFFRGIMKKLFLVLFLGLLAPICEISARPTAKKVRFASEPQVQTFKPSEPTEKVAQSKVQTAAPKKSIRSRIGNGLLGLAMIWAGPFAIGMAIQHQGKNTPFNILAAGAVASGFVVTLTGFKKIERAIRG
jgi:hypothetical protein